MIDNENSYKKRCGRVIKDTKQNGRLGQTADKHQSGTESSLKKKKEPFSLETKLRIIEVVFIAGASLCVSIVSCITASMEYRLNLANSRLHVEVYCDNTDVNNDGIDDTEIFGVKYIDGIFEDFNVNCYSVITLTYFEPNELDSKEISFLIRDYFFVGYLGGAGEYFYAELTEDNWSKYCDLSEYLLSEQEEYSDAFVNLNHYAIISYKNVVGNTEVLGYKCKAAGRFNTADPTQIKQYINGFGRKDTITLDDLTPDVFMGKVKEITAEQAE